MTILGLPLIICLFMYQFQRQQLFQKLVHNCDCAKKKNKKKRKTEQFYCMEFNIGWVH